MLLAGGSATRFSGKPKGLERVGGVRILDRLVDEFTTALGAPPLLVANAPEAETWRPDLVVVPDARPGCGSLGGIYTALVAANGPVVVAAWDMPFVPAGLLQVLAAGLDNHDAYLPPSGGRRGMEPMCAAYGLACLTPISSRLDRGELLAIGFHPDVRVGILPLAELRRFGDPETLFFNVNTADDLAKANELWRQRASVPSSAGRTPEKRP